jgi:TonB family protein
MNTAAIRHDSDWIGQVVDGKFPLIQWLGSNGPSDVFLTELQSDARQKAAIKFIPANDPYAEARMAGWSAGKKLSHPHLMRLVDAGQCEINGIRLFYAVTEYAEENLSQILPERPLTPAEAREMLDPLLGALGYLHREGMVHDHLKPSNIMAVNDQLKLSCDGIQAAGRKVKPSSTLTVFDAPERATQGLSPATDIWALGVTLVEALTQAPPAWDKTKQTDPLVPPRMPNPFADIARDCLRTDPALRCSLSDIQARLNPAPAIASKPVLKERPVPPPTVKAEPKRFSTGAVSGALLVLIIAIGFLFMRSRTTQPATATVPQQSIPAAESPTAPTPLSRGSETAKSSKGAVASQVLPDVSANASSTIHGTVKVTVKVAVDPTGSVSDATLESPGPSRYFSGRALEAARKWTFKAAQVDGKPVASTWILQFEFRQTGISVTPTETSPPDL